MAENEYKRQVLSESDAQHKLAQNICQCFRSPNDPFDSCLHKRIPNTVINTNRRILGETVARNTIMLSLIAFIASNLIFMYILFNFKFKNSFNLIRKQKRKSGAKTHFLMSLMSSIICLVDSLLSATD